MNTTAVSTVEFLRSEMEAGRIHLRVSTDPIFREELAKKAFRSRVYVDPVSGKFSTSKKNWRFVFIDNLVNSEGNTKDEIVIHL